MGSVFGWYLYRKNPSPASLKQFLQQLISNKFQYNNIGRSFILNCQLAIEVYTWQIC
jgi:hypothetical protein